MPEFADLDTPARTIVLDPKSLHGVPHSCLTMALVAAGIAETDILTDEALLAASTRVSRTYADKYHTAVETALGTAAAR